MTVGEAAHEAQVPERAVARELLCGIPCDFLVQGRVITVATEVDGAEVPIEIEVAVVDPPRPSHRQGGHP